MCQKSFGGVGEGSLYQALEGCLVACPHKAQSHGHTTASHNAQICLPERMPVISDKSKSTPTPPPTISILPHLNDW